MYKFVAVTNQINLSQDHRMNKIQQTVRQVPTSLRILLNYKNNKMSRNKAVFIITLHLLSNGWLEENFHAIDIIIESRKQNKP